MKSINDCQCCESKEPFLSRSEKDLERVLCEEHHGAPCLPARDAISRIDWLSSDEAA